MGLDVYLYKYEDFEKVIFAEDEYERLSGEAWRFGGKKYEELTDDEKDYARERDKVFMLSLGLVGYGKSPLKQEVELPSSKYPDHYFKIGYFRSSYNEGGVDHILRDRTGHELATIFDVNGNYRVKPNWETARKKAVSVLDSLKKYLDTNGSYHVMTVENNPFRQSIDIKSQKDALEAFNEERQRYGRGGSDFNWYSNHKGEFFLGKPPALVAAINGISGTFKQPCAYLIYKSDDEEGEGLDWYIHALEIVIETIDYVLAQPDPDKYYLHWSR